MHLIDKMLNLEEWIERANNGEGHFAIAVALERINDRLKDIAGHLLDD